MTAIPLDKIDSILKKGKNLEEQLGKENTSEKFVELSKEYSEIQPLYESVVEWKNIYLEISDLKSDPYAIEKIAREKLNLTKPGDRVYHIVKTKKSLLPSS